MVGSQAIFAQIFFLFDLLNRKMSKISRNPEIQVILLDIKEWRSTKKNVGILNRRYLDMYNIFFILFSRIVLDALSRAFYIRKDRDVNFFNTGSFMLWQSTLN